MRHDISVPQEMLGHGGFIALRKTVAARPALFDVRGVHRQDVAFPFTGGKSHKRVRGIRGRMRTAVHPDGARLLISADVIFDRDHLLRVRILLVPDPQMQRSMINIRRHVHPALMFLQREARSVPAFGEMLARNC